MKTVKKYARNNAEKHKIKHEVWTRTQVYGAQDKDFNQLICNQKC